MSEQRRRHWLFWLLATLAALLFLYLIREILLPFAAGFAIAYFFDPLVNWLERKGLGRLGGTLLVSLGFLLLAVLLLLLVVPLLVEQVTQLINDLPTYATTVKQKLKELMDWVSTSTGIDLKSHLVDGASGDSAPGTVGTITDLLTSLVAGGLALANVLSLLLITPLVAFYLLLNWNRIVERIDSLLPRRHLATLRDLFHQMDRVLAGFLRGQAAVCGIMAVYYATALSIGGLRYGLLVGLLAGILTFVPFVGALTGLVLTLVLSLIQFDSAGPVALLLGLYFVGQMIEGNVITPRVVGRAIGLHDLWLIFAVLAGGALLGAWGVLLAVPVAGCLGVLVRFAIQRYQAGPYYRGTPPSDPGS